MKIHNKDWLLFSDLSFDDQNDLRAITVKPGARLYIVDGIGEIKPIDVNICHWLANCRYQVHVPEAIDTVRAYKDPSEVPHDKIMARVKTWKTGVRWPVTIASNGVNINEERYSFERALKELEWLDGSPMGVEL